MQQKAKQQKASSSGAAGGKGHEQAKEVSGGLAQGLRTQLANALMWERLRFQLYAMQRWAAVRLESAFSRCMPVRGPQRRLPSGRGLCAALGDCSLDRTAPAPWRARLCVTCHVGLAPYSGPLLQTPSEAFAVRMGHTGPGGANASGGCRCQPHRRVRRLPHRRRCSAPPPHRTAQPTRPRRSRRRQLSPQLRPHAPREAAAAARHVRVAGGGGGGDPRHAIRGAARLPAAAHPTTELGRVRPHRGS